MTMKNKMLALVGGLILSTSLAAGAQVVVRIGPPPPRPVEVWVPGHWAEPPYGGARWVPGHWRPTPHGYVWVEGHWRR
jgi:hypothetical protein